MYRPFDSSKNWKSTQQYQSKSILWGSREFDFTKSSNLLIKASEGLLCSVITLETSGNFQRYTYSSSGKSKLKEYSG